MAILSVRSGITSTDLGTSSEMVLSSAIQSDNKILVVGSILSGAGYYEFVLTRFNADGTLDTSFGVKGQIETSFGGAAVADSVLVQPDGSILVSGGALGTSFALARFTPDGGQDASFGWSGKVITNVGGCDYAVSALQPDGKILVTGGSSHGFTLARYQANGSPDMSFGSGGVATTAFGSAATNEACGIGLQQDGKILVAGYSWNGSAYNEVLIRYNADGSIDQEFGSNGTIHAGTSASDHGGTVLVQPDGKILVAWDNEIARYDSHGGIDIPFGDSGTIHPGSISSATLQPDGAILVSGGSLGITRYSPNGAVDPSLTGVAFPSLGGDSSQAQSLSLQSDGKVVVSGITSGTTGTNITLVRYTADGVLDPSFGAPVNNAKITGTPDNDTIIGGPATDTIDGGGGVNTVVYDGPLADYAVHKSGNAVTVSDNVPAHGVDTLTNIQHLQFSDMTIDLTIHAKAATLPVSSLNQLIELYIAYFDRVPDSAGLSYWIDQYRSGQSLEQIGESFYAAAIQYSRSTGYSSSMSNADFVKLIYANVLGGSGSNAPSQADVDHWANSLAMGTTAHGTLVMTMLDQAMAYQGDATLGWVADLLNSKVAVGKTFAVDMGLGFMDPNQAITEGMAIAAAVTPTDNAHAISLIGVDPGSLQLV